MFLTQTSVTFPGLGLELELPCSFSVFGLELQLFGILIAVGLLAAMLYAMGRAKRFGLKEDDLLDGLLWTIPLAVIFARLYYCVFHWSAFAEAPLTVITGFSLGGLSITGGMLGMLLGAGLFARFKRVRLGAVLDLVSVSFLLGQAVGLWGNLFACSCTGAASDGFLRMGVEANGVVTYCHPTFLYESLWSLAGFVVLHLLTRRRRYDGQLALGFVAWYGFGEAILESLHTDSLVIPGTESLRADQLLFALACLVAVVALLLGAMKPHDRAQLFVNTRPQEPAEAEEPEQTGEAEETEEAQEVQEAEETEKTEEVTAQEEE